METFSPIFRRSIEAISTQLRRNLGFPELGRPRAETAFYTSRDSILRAISESGDPKNVLPFFGIKLSNVFVNPESYNQRLLKRHGFPLAYSEATTNDDSLVLYTFFGRPVRVEADVIFFSDNYDEVLSVIEQILFLGSELHFKLRFKNGSIPIKFSISKDGLAVPEADFQSDTANFEFSFQVSLQTYSGFIRPVPVVKKVKLQGGPIFDKELDFTDGRTLSLLQVDRQFSIARGVPDGEFINQSPIVYFDIDPNTDVVDGSKIK